MPGVHRQVMSSGSCLFTFGSFRPNKQNLNTRDAPLRERNGRTRKRRAAGARFLVPYGSGAVVRQAPGVPRPRSDRVHRRCPRASAPDPRRPEARVGGDTGPR
ncbi:hypothetical protein GCM10018792_53510 [Streptomyces rubradiris]|nr:hypothetical protein GCM10018792_53510 [Streptomyces rubradiris]